MLFLTSAIVIMAPHDVQTIAVPIMRRHGNDDLLRLPPHLPIQSPFVGPQQLRDACDALGEICAGIKPFDLTLSGYDRQPGTAAMRLVNPEPILSIRRQIQELLPDGVSISSTYPSLTVARFPGEAEQRSITLPEYVAITFRVYRLHVVYGVEQITLPWLTFDVPPLGG